eukprot:6402928-Prymnesium_polylepis.1
MRGSEPGAARQRDADGPLLWSAAGCGKALIPFHSRSGGAIQGRRFKRASMASFARSPAPRA